MNIDDLIRELTRQRDIHRRGSAPVRILTLGPVEQTAIPAVVAARPDGTVGIWAIVPEIDPPAGPSQCTHGADCAVHPKARKVHNYDNVASPVACVPCLAEIRWDGENWIDSDGFTSHPPYDSDSEEIPHRHRP